MLIEHHRVLYQCLKATRGVACWNQQRPVRPFQALHLEQSMATEEGPSSLYKLASSFRNDNRFSFTHPFAKTPEFRMVR